MFSEAIVKMKIAKLVSDAETLISEKQYGAAIRILQEAILINSERVDVYMKLARAYSLVHDDSSASSAWNVVREKSPRSIVGYVQGARSALNLGDLESAVELLDKAAAVFDVSDLNYYYYYIVWETFSRLLIIDDVERSTLHRLLTVLLNEPARSAKAPVLSSQTNSLFVWNRKLYSKVLSSITEVIKAKAESRAFSDTELFVCVSLNLWPFLTAYTELEALQSVFSSPSVERLSAILCPATKAHIISKFESVVDNYGLDIFLSGMTLSEQCVFIFCLSGIHRLDLVDDFCVKMKRERESRSLRFLPKVLEPMLARYSGDNHFINNTQCRHGVSRERRLRMAVCVSGQLRGYQRAFRSWMNFNFQSNEVDYFIHTWQDIGRKYPIIAHADRCFPSKFAIVFKDTAIRNGIAWMETHYPTLFSLFNGGDLVSHDQIQSFYSSKVAIVEDDRAGKYASFTNPQKMYYKIFTCNRIMLDTLKGYDLVIRIRPDLYVNEMEGVSWFDIYKRCTQDNAIFVDFPIQLHPTMGYIMGDKFAVGTVQAMTVYSSTYTGEISASLPDCYAPPRELRAHTNLAYTCFFGGLSVKPFCFKGIELIDPEPVTGEAIVRALDTDIASRPSTCEDSELLRAGRLCG